jgi:hypothetical protein
MTLRLKVVWLSAPMQKGLPTNASDNKKHESVTFFDIRGTLRFAN